MAQKWLKTPKYRDLGGSGPDPVLDTVLSVIDLNHWTAPSEYYVHIKVHIKRGVILGVIFTTF